MTEQTGRCPLPVHDSFVVAAVDAPLLSRTMESVASEQGLAPKLKRIRPSPTDHNPVTPCPCRAHAGRGTS